ncbi:HSP20-like chaperone domain protein [Pseudohyphozyma bogoriensis]|nr:HSP20-like chaperone domain protein [Pseudohyphozyma bogoriensis]
MVTPPFEPTSQPFFPPPSTVRPAFPQGQGSSDSSVDTVSSLASTDTYSSETTTSSHGSGDSEHPYSRLVFIDRAARSHGQHSSSDPPRLDALPPLARLSLDFPPSSPTSSHSATYPPPSLPVFPASSSMARSRSANNQPQRPSSAGTSSTNTSASTFSSFSSMASIGLGSSSRPWVRDSDASSVCSAGSSRQSTLSTGNAPSSGQSTGGDIYSEPEENTDGEVFKVEGGQDMEFLDPRPEPAGATMTIDRNHPTQVVLRVVLPGFSIDNITVAMRRGHKVHIVADKYSEEGGKIAVPFVFAAAKGRFPCLNMTLPKVGRRIAFKSALLGRASTPSPVSTSLPLAERGNDSDKALSASSPTKSGLRVVTGVPQSPSPESASSVASSSSFTSEHSTTSSSTSFTHLNLEDEHSPSPTRPKLRPGDLNLTLRAHSGKSFRETAAQAIAGGGEDEDEGRGDVVTPRGDRDLQFAFSPVDSHAVESPSTVVGRT